MNQMKIYVVLLCCILSISFGFHSGCISDGDTLEIKTFEADPSIVDPGEKTTLHWIVTGATAVSIDPTIGNVNLIGSKTLVLHETTTFTLTARNENVTMKETVIVYVQKTTYPEAVVIDDEIFEQAKRDTFTFNNVLLDDDLLVINMSYSGGCEEHIFTLISRENFMESEPVQIDLVLSHDAQNDPCEAYITEILVFNISALKQKWQQEYQQDSGEIILLLENFSEPIHYMFGDDQFSFLNVTIQTDGDVFGINSTIPIHIFVENLKEQVVVLEFPDSQVADFHCKNQTGEVVYLWSYEKAFNDVITPVTIPANTKVEIFNFSWYRTSNIGDVLENGEYMLQGWIPGFYYQDENLNFSMIRAPNIYSDQIQITFV